MKINPVEVVPLDRLHTNPDNPKKPMGARYARGLKASLAEFGFAGALPVASNLDGSYSILDGNTREEELSEAGVREVPCAVVEDLAEGATPDWRERRQAFVLAYDRVRKTFDEDVYLDQLRQLAGKGQDVGTLGRLTATDNLQRILDEAGRKNKAAVDAARGGKASPHGSMVLYGPIEDIDAVRQLTKRIRGRLSPLVKLRAALEQAEQFEALDDEAFLVAFCAAVVNRDAS